MWFKYAREKEPGFPATILFRWFHGETSRNLEDARRNEFSTSESGLKRSLQYAKLQVSQNATPKLSEITD